MHTHAQVIHRRCVISCSDVLPVVEVSLQLMSPSLLGCEMHVDLNYTPVRPDGLQLRLSEPTPAATHNVLVSSTKHQFEWRCCRLKMYKECGWFLSWMKNVNYLKQTAVYSPLHHCWTACPYDSPLFLLLSEQCWWLDNQKIDLPTC